MSSGGDVRALMEQTQQSNMSGAGNTAVSGGPVQGAANTRLFLRRLGHLKEKLESELEFVKISRDKTHDKAPRNGKRVLEDERNAS